MGRDSAGSDMSDTCCGGRCATSERRVTTVDEPDRRPVGGPGGEGGGARGFDEHYCAVHDVYYCGHNHDNKSTYNHYDDGPIYDLDSTYNDNNACTHYDYDLCTADHNNRVEHNHYRWWM